MRTSFFSSPSTAETLKKDCRTLADDAMKTARHMVDPALDAAQRARGYAREAMHDAQGRINRHLTEAERFAGEQYDRTGRWVSAHPFKAVGIALAAGLLLSSLFQSGSRK